MVAEHQSPSQAVIEPPVIKTLSGQAASAHADTLARLRIEVFREWPYLYDGSEAYERNYLTTYFQCPQSLILVAWAGQQIVGASTALPLADADPDMQAPFIHAGLSLTEWLYFGESVVLPEYRGLGLGVGFFAEQIGRAHV